MPHHETHSEHKRRKEEKHLEKKILKAKTHESHMDKMAHGQVVNLEASFNTKEPHKSKVHVSVHKNTYKSALGGHHVHHVPKEINPHDLEAIHAKIKGLKHK